MRVIIIFIIAIMVLNMPTSIADRGIVPHSQIPIYEPDQKAIIGFNGEKEVLILSTNVYGLSNTKALEIMPFPSPPKIERGSKDSFTKIQKITGYYGQVIEFNSSDNRNYLGEIVSIEIIFYEIIGNHHLTTIKINSMKNFEDWISNYLEERGLSKDILPNNLNSIIESYVNSGIQYFVFDEIDISYLKRSVEPLVYTFNTSYIYYPLRISALIKSETTIILFCLSDKNINWDSIEELGFQKIINKVIDKKNLTEIDLNLSNLFEGNAEICVFKYFGNIQKLDKDVKAVVEPEIETDNKGIQLALLVAYPIILLVIFIGFNLYIRKFKTH